MIAYNESNALSGLFRDIALQDYPHDKIEVVFVDSMSTDDTKEKMEKFRDADYGFWNVSVVQCVKRNQATSWNAALMTAKGDIIIELMPMQGFRETLFHEMFIILSREKM